MKDDQALIAAYRAGDDAAFARIHERHHAPLERYARKVLGRSSEHAEDVVQEAMLRASRALRRDDRHIELRPWLFRLDAQHGAGRARARPHRLGRSRGR